MPGILPSPLIYSSYTLRCPGTSRGEVGGAGSDPRAPRLPSCLQRVSCRPASGSRPPPGSASGHKALRGAAGGEGLRVTCGRAEPSPAERPARLPACPPARGVRSLRPFAPARCPGRDSAGYRRARPGRVQAGGSGGQREAAGPRRWPARPPQHVSVRPRRPLPAGRGPLRWGVAPPREGNWPSPFLPPADRKSVV